MMIVQRLNNNQVHNSQADLAPLSHQEVNSHHHREVQENLNNQVELRVNNNPDKQIPADNNSNPVNNNSNLVNNKQVVNNKGQVALNKTKVVKMLPKMPTPTTQTTKEEQG